MKLFSLTSTISTNLSTVLKYISRSAFAPYAALKVHASEKILYFIALLTAFVQISMTGLGAILWSIKDALIGKMLASCINIFSVPLVSLITLNDTKTIKMKYF